MSKTTLTYYKVICRTLKINYIIENSYEKQDNRFSRKLWNIKG